MDELSWVAPVRISTRRAAPVTPEDMGEPTDDPFYTSIWFDQGGTTGWSVFGIWPEAMYRKDLKILAHVAAWSAGEFTGNEAQMTDQMMALVEAWGDDAKVGYEDFILQKFLMSRDLLSPVRMSARFEDRMYMAARDHQIQKPQLASLAMRTVTDERLKAWGFWLPGQDHARDAVRHNITWLRRIKESYVDNGLPGPPRQDANGSGPNGGEPTVEQSAATEGAEPVAS